jgi:uncharacterized membrane protein (UPF0127 family)
LATTSFYEVVNTRTGEVLVDRARLATSITSRSIGLLGKKGLGPHEALVIRPCWSIHTLFMRFRLDVLFLGKDGAVRKVIHSMPAYRFAASRGARDTIEMAPGVLADRDLLVGDILEIRSVNV